MAFMTPFAAIMHQRVHETSPEKARVNAQKDYQGNPIVMVQEPGEKGNWAKELTTPPFQVCFNPELNAEGNLGDKFAPTKDQAKFRIVLKEGELDGLFQDPSDLAVAQQAQLDWIAGVNRLNAEVFTGMLRHKDILKKPSAEVLDMYAKMRKCKKNEVQIDDEVVETWCSKATSVPVDMSKTPCLITAKNKVFKKNWKDPTQEPRNVPVPIWDRRGLTQLNKEDNETMHVNRGDFVSLRVRFSSYITPMGAFGTKFDLLGVTLLKRGKKRNRGAAETIGSLDIFADSDDEAE